MFLYIWLKFIAMIFYMFCNIQIHDSIQLNFQAPRQTIICIFFSSSSSIYTKVVYIYNTHTHNIILYRILCTAKLCFSQSNITGWNAAVYNFFSASLQFNNFFSVYMLLIKELKLIAHFSVIIISMLRFLSFFSLYNVCTNWNKFFFAEKV